jgi:hypothetical protein
MDSPCHKPLLEFNQGSQHSIECSFIQHSNEGFLGFIQPPGRRKGGEVPGSEWGAVSGGNGERPGVVKRGGGVGSDGVGGSKWKRWSGWSR